LTPIARKLIHTTSLFHQALPSLFLPSPTCIPLPAAPPTLSRRRHSRRPFATPNRWLPTQTSSQPSPGTADTWATRPGAPFPSSR
jgi:hypothetical protein